MTGVGRPAHLGYLVGGGAATVAAVIVVLPLLMFIVVVAGGSQAKAGCAGSTPGSGKPGTLSTAQLQNATTIVSVGSAMRVPAKAIVIALAAALTESGLRNYANDGTGQLTLFQFGVADSLAYPHEAVGHDHGSLGLFQQQWPGWGSIPDLMTPATAARKFYAALLAIPQWQTMSEGDAAQAVESSQFPARYADAVPTAEGILNGSANTADANQAPAGLDLQSCGISTVDPGAGRAPLPAGSYQDLHNFGAIGPRWANGHTGTDLVAPCGTPVVAATNGHVVIRTDQPWAGNWLVEVSTGTRRLTTWYAHMRAVDVTDGQSVQAGQQLGEVGDLGNADGCHLHFEVHPLGGGFGADEIDPSSWLAQTMTTSAPTNGINPSASSAGALSVVVAAPGAASSQPQLKTLLSTLLGGAPPDLVILVGVPNASIAALLSGVAGSWQEAQGTDTSGAVSTVIWNADRLDQDPSASPSNQTTSEGGRVSEDPVLLQSASAPVAVLLSAPQSSAGAQQGTDLAQLQASGHFVLVAGHEQLDPRAGTSCPGASNGSTASAALAALPADGTITSQRCAVVAGTSYLTAEVQIP